ncbi:MAG: cell division protein FtsL [Hyphomicrobiaceae bacterium]
MFRMFMFLAVGAALLSAFALYAISYQTRQISDANQMVDKRIKELNRDIAILRAERSFLTRPERLEPLARKLGLRPVRGDQFISHRSLQTQTKQP